MAHKTIELFHEIKSPSEITVNLFFNAWNQLKPDEVLVLTKDTLSKISKTYYTNPQILTSLLDSLMKCRDIERAQSLFDESKTKSVEMYEAMLKGYIDNQMVQKAIELFHEIKNPTEATIIFFLNACAQLGTDEALNLTKQILSKIPKSYYRNARRLTSLLGSLMKCGDIERAQSLFDESKTKSVDMYGAMMKGYIKNRKANKAIELYNQVKNPDEVLLVLFFNACAALGTNEELNLIKKALLKTPKSLMNNSNILTSLLDALIKCGDCSYAEQILLQTKASKSDYGMLMSEFNKENNFMKTINLFNQMKNHHSEEDLGIYLNIIKALASVRISSILQPIVDQIPRSFLINHQILNAAIDIWEKLGNVEKAKENFRTINQPAQHGYAKMINAFGFNGMGNQAIEFFYSIPRDYINDTTYIYVLNACSHCGLVEQARFIFQNADEKTATIYVAMIDCLSRAALFEEVEKLIDQYEHDHPPSWIIHIAVLSGARNKKNSSLVEKMYQRMKKLFPESKEALESVGTLLGNVYGSSGVVDGASNIRSQSYQTVEKRTVSFSFTAVENEVYRFRPHDRSHPRSKEIYIESKKISKEIIQHGHKYDPSWITRPLSANETVESVFCGHSERLAIAWNFVVNPHASRIQITNNLRLCGDCHRAIKLIAKIRQCEIIVRDANRIHRFSKNGPCSCNDYF